MRALDHRGLPYDYLGTIIFHTPTRRSVSQQAEYQTKRPQFMETHGAKGGRCVSSKPLVRITCKFKRIYFSINDFGRFDAILKCVLIETKVTPSLVVPVRPPPHHHLPPLYISSPAPPPPSLTERHRLFCFRPPIRHYGNGIEHHHDEFVTSEQW
jgi:hypothetical protein